MTQKISENMDDTCEICGRNVHHILIRVTAFNLKPTIGPFYKPLPNPEYKEYKVCGTDITLFYKIQKTLPENKREGRANVDNIIELAREYRKSNPPKT